MVLDKEPNLEDKVTEAKKPEIKIDPDLSPNNPMNKEAAGRLGWYFDGRCYRDADGPIADKYGQPLG